MNKIRDEIRDLFVTNGIVKFGEFTLKSGKASSLYFDLRIVPSIPKIMIPLCRLLMTELKLWAPLVGVPFSGLTFAAAIAMVQELPLLYVRPQAKEYGTKKRIEGRWHSGQKVIVVDDVMTTGGSVIETIEALSAEDIEAKQVLVIVDRRSEEYKKHMDEMGITVTSLFKEADFDGYGDLSQPSDFGA